MPKWNCDLRDVRKRLFFRLTVTLVVIAFLASNLFFWRNGGFGGGHLDYDPLLGILAIPWLFIWPKLVWGFGDYAALVVAPFLGNIAVILVLRVAFGRRTES